MYQAHRDEFGKAFAPRGERLLATNYTIKITFAADMKKMSVLSMLISFAMICSCQKQDSAPEQQLAERKTEPEARETALTPLIERLDALDEKVNALDKKVKALFEKEQATLNAGTTGTTATGVQGQTPDPAEVIAERDRAIQQFRALLPNPSRVRAGDPAKQGRPATRQLGPEDLQRQWQQNLDKAKTSAAEAGSPIPSPTPE